MCPALAAVGTGEPSSYVQQQVREFLSEGSITNYVTLVGRSLGINHEELFLKWRRWNDPERVLSDIWADVSSRLDQLSWSRDRIETVIRRAFEDGLNY